MAKIYLNAGHGGKDSGAVGVNNCREKDETLKLAKAVQPLLQSAGHTVKLSRVGDVYTPVSAIADEANAWGADLFCAIHLNCFNGSAQGTECLVVSSASNTSRKMAAEITNRLAAIGFRARGVKVQDKNTLVLRRTKMPATTVEVCFIDSFNDMDRYGKNTSTIVRAIADGILAVAGGCVNGIPVAAPDQPLPATYYWKTGLDKYPLYAAPHDQARIQVQLQPGDDIVLDSYFDGDEWARVKAAVNGVQYVGYIKFDMISRR